MTHIVAVVDPPPKCPSHIQRLHVKLADSFDANVLQHLPQTTAFIKSALAENESNVVLVRGVPLIKERDGSLTPPNCDMS